MGSPSFRRLLSSGLVAAALLTATTARADEEHYRPFELGIFAGGYFYNEDNGLGRGKNDPKGLSPDNSVYFGARFGYGFIPRLTLEGEVYFVPTSTRDGRSNEPILGYRAHLLVHLIDTGRFRPFILAGYGLFTSFPEHTNIVPQDTDDSMYGGIGFKIFLTPAIALRVDGRIDVSTAIFGVGSESYFGGPDFEVNGGLSFAFGGGGPPPPPPPPVAVAPKDTDGDGIPDNIDKCPTEPEDKDGFQDDDGCPDPDNDGDGILDVNDKCPNQPEDKDGFQDDDGCPDPDNDNDGIPDVSDKCPNEPETVNGYQDQDGCPDTVPAAVKKFTGAIQGINFKLGSAEITKGSYPTLDKAAQVLKDFPDVKLEIQGHTDNIGPAAYNKDLSQRRAESVRTYLISKGISEDRLTAHGYGLEQPIADNKTEAGRAKNRRVEFKLQGF